MRRRRAGGGRALLFRVCGRHTSKPELIPPRTSRLFCAPPARPCDAHEKKDEKLVEKSFQVVQGPGTWPAMVRKSAYL